MRPFSLQIDRFHSQPFEKQTCAAFTQCAGSIQAVILEMNIQELLRSSMTGQVGTCRDNWFVVFPRGEGIVENLVKVRA